VQDLISVFLTGEAGSTVAQQAASSFQIYAVALALSLAVLMFSLTSMRLAAGRGSLAVWVVEVAEIILRTIIALWLISQFTTFLTFAQDARRGISVAASGSASVVDNVKFADGIASMIERYRIAILAANGITDPPPEEAWMARSDGEALDDYLRRVAAEALRRGVQYTADTIQQGTAFVQRVADALKEGEFRKLFDALFEKFLDATGISKATNTFITTVVGGAVSIVGAIVALGVVAPTVVFFLALAIGVLAIATLPTKAPIAETLRSGVLDVMLSSLIAIAVVVTLLKLFEPLIAVPPATTGAVGSFNLATGLGADLTRLMFMASFIAVALPIANGLFSGRVPQVNPVLAVIHLGFQAAKFAVKFVIKVVK
jgi:hypothetical protein